MSEKHAKRARRAEREARGISKGAARAERAFEQAVARRRVELAAAPMERRDTRRRWLAWLGLAIICVGLLALAFLGAR